jgi:hypothetical protein
MVDFFQLVRQLLLFQTLSRIIEALVATVDTRRERRSA